MDNTFYTNTIWYIALAATSAIELVIIFVKTSERKKILAFCFAVLGFTYGIEVALLLLFNAYTYYPMICPDDPFFDAVLGNIFSQVSVTSSAVLICILGLSKRWLAGFSAAYFLIDVYFVQLGIYEHFWFRSVFTFAGFFIYSLIVKYWYKRVFSSPPRWLYGLTLFLSTWSISANISGTLLKLLDLRVFQADFYSDPSRNHTAAALIYGSVMAVIMMALCKWRLAWWHKILFFLLLLGCQWGLLQYSVIVIKPGWDMVVMLFDLVVFYGGTVTMDRYLRDECKTLLPPN